MAAVPGGNPTNDAPSAAVNAVLEPGEKRYPLLLKALRGASGGSGLSSATGHRAPHFLLAQGQSGDRQRPRQATGQKGSARLVR